MRARSPRVSALPTWPRELSLERRRLAAGFIKTSSGTAAAKRSALPGSTQFLTGIDRLSDERNSWMFVTLAAGQPYGEVGRAPP